MAIECWCDAHAARVAGGACTFFANACILFSAPCYLTEPARGKDILQHGLDYD